MSGDGDEISQSDVSNSDDDGEEEEAIMLLPGHAPLDTSGGKRHKAKRKKLKRKTKKMDNEKQALLRLQEVLYFVSIHEGCICISQILAFMILIS